MSVVDHNLYQSSKNWSSVSWTAVFSFLTCLFDARTCPLCRLEDPASSGRNKSSSDVRLLECALSKSAITLGPETVLCAKSVSLT